MDSRYKAREHFRFLLTIFLFRLSCPMWDKVEWTSRRLWRVRVACSPSQIEINEFCSTCSNSTKQSGCSPPYLFTCFYFVFPVLNWFFSLLGTVLLSESIATSTRSEEISWGNFLNKFVYQTVFEKCTFHFIYFFLSDSFFKIILAHWHVVNGEVATYWRPGIPGKHEFF